MQADTTKIPPEPIVSPTNPASAAAATAGSLGGQLGDSHHAHREADPGWVPVVGRRKINGQERLEATSHVGQHEIE
jgi:hypothetical protein